MKRLVAGVLLAVGFVLAAAPVASAETRTLKLYFVHTKERAEIAYKRNGRYLQSGLNEINRFLRDWRRNEPAKMDPQLLDLLWEVYRSAGARDYIHVVSAYRSPATNAMLRSRSSGVAEKSQHMLGKAVDFYIPGVKLSTLRAVGLKMQVGGVGYYPRSGSPFVHLDVGSVRHWPRMSRKELASIFPDGKTIHVPTDGKPLPGYQQALASYQSRQRNGGSIQIADDSGGGKRGRGLLAALFGGGADEEEDIAETQVAAAPAPVPARTVRQPEPQPVPQQEAETPGAILAALPARAVPLPRLAPRPEANVGAGVQVAAAQQPETAQPADLPFQVAVPAPAEEVLTAAYVPVPTSRPDYTPSAPATQVAEASEAASALTALVTPTTRPQPPASADAIAQLLVAQKDEATEDEAEPVMAAYAPVPGTRPGEAEAEYTVASLPQVDAASAVAQKADTFAALPAALGEVKHSDGQPVSASPRVALLQSGGRSSPNTLVSSGAKTTPKDRRPSPADARPTPNPVVLPVAAVTAELALSRESVASRKPDTKAPVFTAEIAEAPTAVYTDGFQQNVVVADARRFTGKAVTFLSVAKFDQQ